MIDYYIIAIIVGIFLYVYMQSAYWLVSCSPPPEPPTTSAGIEWVGESLCTAAAAAAAAAATYGRAAAVKRWVVHSNKKQMTWRVKTV